MKYDTGVLHAKILQTKSDMMNKTIDCGRCIEEHILTVFVIFH